MRMVPASTLRRNDATIVGTTTNTPRRMRTIRRTGDMVYSMWKVRIRWTMLSSASRGHGTPVSRGVHVLDAQAVAGADADAGGALLGRERAEDLHDLPVELHHDEPLAARVERARGLRLVRDRALERQRGRAGEALEEAPQRRHE